MNTRIMSLMAASLEARSGLQAPVLPEDLSTSFESLELHDYDVASVESIYQTLGKIADNIEASLESETLTDSSLDMAQIAVESNAEQLGVSVESLATFDGVEKATVTVESLGDTLKKLWETIRTAVERAIKALRDFFAKLFGGIKKLSAYFNRLKSEVKKLDSDPEGEITVRSASNLIYNGKVSVEGILEGLGNSRVVGEILMGPYVDTVNQYYETVANQMIDKDFIGASVQDKQHILKKYVLFNPNDDLWIAHTRRITKAGEIIGGYIPQKGTIATGDTLKFERKGDESLNQGYSLQALSKKEMIKMIDSSLDVLSQIEKREKAIEKIAKGREEVLKSLKEFVKASDRGLLGSFWTNDHARRVMAAGNRNLVYPVNQYTNFTYSSLRAVGDLVEKTLKA